MNETLLNLVNDCDPLAVCGDIEKTNAKIAKARELAELGFYDLAGQIEKEYAPKIKLEKIARFGYRRITREKIEKFLQRKVDLYNKEHEGGITYHEGEITYAEYLRQKIEIQEHGVPKPTINKTKNINDVIAHLQWLRQENEIRERQRNRGTPWQLFQSQQEHYRTIDTDNALIVEASTCHYSGGGPVGKFVWSETRIDKYKGIPPANVLETLREHKARNLFDYFTIATANEVKDPLLLGRVDACDDRFFIAQWGDDVSLDDVV